MTAITKEQREKWKDMNPLRKHRQRNDLSLMAMAATIGCGVSAIQQWESGSAVPSPEKMHAIAAALDTNAAALDVAWSRWMKRHPRNNIAA